MQPHFLYELLAAVSSTSTASVVLSVLMHGGGSCDAGCTQRYPPTVTHVLSTRSEACWCLVLSVLCTYMHLLTRMWAGFGMPGVVWGLLTLLVFGGVVRTRHRELSWGHSVMAGAVFVLATASFSMVPDPDHHLVSLVVLATVGMYVSMAAGKMASFAIFELLFICMFVGAAFVHGPGHI